MTPSEEREGRSRIERRYRTKLSTHLRAGATRDGADASRLGRDARSLGIATLTLARIHDRAVAAITARKRGSPPLTEAATARAESFFALAASNGVPARAAVNGSPAREGHPVNAPRSLRAELRQEVARRKSVQTALDECEHNHAILAKQSQRMEERLHHLSRRLLNAQEEERARISRDLHDAIGQTLVGINVGLATLQQEAMSDSKELAEGIAMTQELVDRSMRSVHAFARELRPTVLDDFGLGPALRAHAIAFGERTGLAVRYVGAADATRLSASTSIALFRVAQEALTNVARHARARKVSVVLRRLPTAIRLEVRDDGQSFDVARLERSRKNQHLGLLGMQERMDMVGGRFSVESVAGKGTTVRAEVPLDMEACE
jgi:signal transduction histidine kinase